ncbi:MAG: helix-turn-helix transcriptional regulator [Melioribacteraceae bacterium]
MRKNNTNGFYKRIGQLIKKKRVATEPLISQETLGRLIGLSRVSVVNIEQGKHRIHIHTLFDIANVLQEDVSEFFPGDYSKEKIVSNVKVSSEEINNLMEQAESKKGMKK